MIGQLRDAVVQWFDVIEKYLMIIVDTIIGTSPPLN